MSSARECGGGRLGGASPAPGGTVPRRRVAPTRCRRSGRTAAPADADRKRGGGGGAFARACGLCRESWEHAPPGSWGRPIAILKARVLAGAWEEAVHDAGWTLEQ